MSRSSLCLCLCLVISVGLAGCQSKPSDDVTPSPAITETAEAVTLEPTPAGDTDLSLTLTPGGAILPPGPVTLTIWTTQEFAPADEDAGGRLLLDQLLAFDRNHPDVIVDVIIKRPAGPGGIMDYLSTASQVAPAVLPDITVLSSQMLRQAVAEEVIQPLDDLLAPETVEGLFPVADELGRVDGRLMGIPFTLDFEHLVYNTAILTDTGPVTWDAIISSGGPYLFPAAEESPVDSTLIHYLAAGGVLHDTEGRPYFEIDPLTEVFRFYQRANAEGAIPAVALQTESLDESWNAYRSGAALIAHVNTIPYLSGRAELLNTATAPIPGPEKATSPFASGWHWVMITSDPLRQQLAAELLDWLMAPDNLGVWSYASQWLPASGGALAVWPTDDEYVKFAHEQILVALPRPDDEYNQVVQPRLSQAVRDVLLGNSTPAAAAAAAATP